MAFFNRIGEFIGLLDEKKYNSLVKVGKFCKEKMDYYVPVDTGFLKSNNDFSVTKYFNQRLRLINDTYYAGFVEYGTSRMKAQPYIRPAMQNHIAEINAIIGGTFRF